MKKETKIIWKTENQKLVFDSLNILLVLCRYFFLLFDEQMNEKKKLCSNQNKKRKS